MFQEQITNLEHTENPQVKIDRMLVLKEPVTELIEKMKEKIESGSYSLIIGDEASGRIPALLLSAVINKIYEERGFDKLKMLFLAGNKPGLPKLEYFLVLDSFLDKHKVELPDAEHSALIVSEYMSTGGRLEPLTQVLRDRGIKYDIAVADTISEGDVEGINNRLGTEVYSADTGGGLAFWKKSDLSGTTRKMNQRNSPMTQRTDDFYPEKIKAVREDIEVLADEIFQEYKKALES